MGDFFVQAKGIDTRDQHDANRTLERRNVAFHVEINVINRLEEERFILIQIDDFETRFQKIRTIEQAAIKDYQLVTLLCELELTYDIPIFEDAEWSRLHSQIMDLYQKVLEERRKLDNAGVGMRDGQDTKEVGQ